jgi:WD40 repeat protein
LKNDDKLKIHNPIITNVKEIKANGIQHKTIINTISYCDISNMFVSGDNLGIIKLWDINTFSCIKTFADIHFNDDGKLYGNSVTYIKFQNNGRTIAYINI